jgi:hypothetical protein
MYKTTKKAIIINFKEKQKKSEDVIIDLTKIIQHTNRLIDNYLEMIHVCIDGSGMRTEFSFSRVEIQT